MPAGFVGLLFWANPIVLRRGVNNPIFHPLRLVPTSRKFFLIHHRRHRGAPLAVLRGTADRAHAHGGAKINSNACPHALPPLISSIPSLAL